MSELPSSWARATIREIAHTSSGGTPNRSKPDYFGGSIPWVKSGELNDGFIRAAEEAITEEGLRNSSAKIFPEGTVCIALYGATVGRTGILGIDASTNQAICGIQPKDGIRRNYLLYFLQSQRAKLVSLSQGGAQPNISQELVRATEIPVAPSTEQDRIVAEIEKQFTRLDAATSALKRVQTNLKRYRASVLKAACEGRLVPTEAELARKEGRDYEPADQLLQRILRQRRARWEADTLAKMIASGKPPKDDRWKQKYVEPNAVDTSKPSSLPEGWCWATVEQLNPGTRPCAYGVLQPGPDIEGGIPIVRVGDIEDGTVATTGLKRISQKIAEIYPRTLLEGDEVLITLVGAIGRTAVAPPSLAGANTARAVGVIPLQVDMVQPEWVEIWFRNPEMMHTMIGKAHEVARMTLNLEDVRAAVVALPPLPEQARIVQKIEVAAARVQPLLDEVGNQLKRGATLRRSVLQSAFSGALVPQDSADEPASLLLDRIRAEHKVKRAASKSPRKVEPAYA